ncbi:MAG: OmpH family outer membrane protein [Pseudomonadales bacterium]|nr:OmpH family outer membrane protein [Pseudomonadales bacterium]
MKRLILATALLFCAFSVHATGKVAVVSFEQAILNTDAAKAEIKALENDKDFKANMKEVKKIQAEGKKLAEKYKKEAAIMSVSQIQELEAKIKGKQADIEHVGRKLQEAKQVLMQGLMRNMGAQAQAAIKDIITAEGIGLLLAANPQVVLHADTSFDITAKLTDKLNKNK